MKLSRDLRETRDHAREMAADESQSDQDRKLWLAIANEIDAFGGEGRADAPEQGDLFESGPG